MRVGKLYSQKATSQENHQTIKARNFHCGQELSQNIQGRPRTIFRDNKRTVLFWLGIVMLR
jgi:hypothetical protein